MRVRDLLLTRSVGDELFVQTRAHSAPVDATLVGDELVFATPQPRVAPGQVVALYDGELCCGGGIAVA